ncbi:MAG: sigma-54-dependent Fis family transcriptional regulator [Planctomycetes bacterium]|nr:sigma-54-dependent Fis family transcriptional regulator [Planctomycetota bacterium]
MRFFLERALDRAGYRVEAVATGEEGVARLGALAPDLVITDLKMPGMDGVEVLERVKTASPRTPVVMITGFGTIAGAVDAMKRGAADYLTKPFDIRAIRLVVDRLARPAVAAPGAPPQLVGVSLALAAVREQIRRVGPTDATVLVQGESGTGKELVARAIHAAGPRRGRPFVAVHCAALPPTLLEAELFGHAAGAFTGAVRAHVGFAARAADGTLFLDEVGDIALPVQAKLLRLLQEREIQPLGAEESVPLRARVAAATHRDLVAMIERGEFREDLYYRLAVIPIHLPPLRARREDVAPLVEHFLASSNRALGRAVPGFSREAMVALGAYRWPGNVRELSNLVERLVAMREGGEIGLEDLPAELRLDMGGAAVSPTASGLPFEAARRAFERDFFERLLEETAGNVSEAARRAGISRPNLYRRLKETGLDPGAFKTA